MIPAMRLARSKTSLILVATAAILVVALLVTSRRPGRRVGRGQLELAARLSSSYVLRGDATQDLAISVRAPSRAATTRPDAAVAIVIDRSGSMTDMAPGATQPPIAEARRAAHELVDRLGAGDQFAIVTYSTDAWLLAPMAPATAEARSAAHRAIDGIAADGGTNISAGLEAATAQLTQVASTVAVRRLVLLSDGKANEGVYTRSGLVALAADIARAAISISTVGVGLEFDEATMTELATAGRGNYYFAEDASRLATLFGDELASVGATVASAAELVITPASGPAGAVELVDAYGYPLRREGGAVIVPIADLRSGETRKVVVRARIRASEVGRLDLARIELRYRDVDTGAAAAQTTVASAIITDDHAAVRAGLDRDTVRMVEQARTARALEEANAAYDRGGYEAARQVIEARTVELEAAADAVGDGALKQDLGQAGARALDNFAAAPAAGAAGASRAYKGNAQEAYKLAR